MKRKLRCVFAAPTPTLPHGGGGRTAGDWMTVGVPRYRHLRNPQHLFPRKDALPRGGGTGLPKKKADALFLGTRGGGSKQPAQLPFYIHLSAHRVCKSLPNWNNP